MCFKRRHSIAARAWKLPAVRPAFYLRILAKKTAFELLWLQLHLKRAAGIPSTLRSEIILLFASNWMALVSSAIRVRPFPLKLPSSWWEQDLMPRDLFTEKSKTSD